jgi:hypothetical protein
VALIALQLVSFIAAAPGFFTLADHPCQTYCALTVQRARSLVGVGISPAVYAATLFIVVTLSVTLATAVALVLLVRRGRDRMALVTAYFVVVLPTTFVLNLAPSEIGSQQALSFAVPPWVDFALTSLQSVVILGICLIFPSGRFVPRWSWVLFIAFIAYSTVFGEWPELQTPLAIGWPLFFGAVAACIGYRYWHVSLPTERQQTKWVAAGFVTFLAICLIYYLPTFTPLGATAYSPLAYLFYESMIPVVPITFFIAMQRYHLYEIDRIINKALVYGSLSAIVAVVYVGGVLSMQAVARTITGQESPLALVASTLLIAALFQPARSRIQKIIDRRFYRARYDAAKTLAAFSATLRQEVSLSELQLRLVGIVEETMRPTHVSLWLAEPQRKSSFLHGPTPTSSAPEGGRA